MRQPKPKLATWKQLKCQSSSFNWKFNTKVFTEGTRNLHTHTTDGCASQLRGWALTMDACNECPIFSEFWLHIYMMQKQRDVILTANIHDERPKRCNWQQIYMMETERCKAERCISQVIVITCAHEKCRLWLPRISVNCSSCLYIHRARSLPERPPNQRRMRTRDASAVTYLLDAHQSTIARGHHEAAASSTFMGPPVAFLSASAVTPQPPNWRSRAGHISCILPPWTRSHPGRAPATERG